MSDDVKEETDQTALAPTKVGYGSPPVHSRFKKGQSGNPSGRANGSQNLKTIFNKVLDEEVTLREVSEVKKVSKAEALVRGMVVDLGETKANAQVAGYLFNASKNGNVTAQIFWLKTRAKWRETPVELKHSGSIGRKDLNELSDEELPGLIYTLGGEVGLALIQAIDGEVSSPARDTGKFLRLIPGT